ncbi:hypothetical protein F8388_002425 [Cannabis sativa]|uniref:Small ribosomal subunit protein uS7 domain-containing protein n=1 Tax=Cannabis sativa TaxID=3483 RepID=A0A7J6DNQ4_CANSA|nr:hypothetical protein F8388_002425 [Cannabis sativa]
MGSSSPESSPIGLELERRLKTTYNSRRIAQLRKKHDLLSSTKPRNRSLIQFEYLYRIDLNRKLKSNGSKTNQKRPLFQREEDRRRQAIRGVTPNIAVKTRRVGGSTHQVPIEIGSTQGKELAIRWLLGASRKCLDQNMVFKLSSELVDAAKGSGDAIRKEEETHRMAEANGAFAYFR